MTAKDNLFCFASAKSNGFKTARLGWLILKFLNASGVASCSGWRETDQSLS